MSLVRLCIQCVREQSRPWIEKGWKIAEDMTLTVVVDRPGEPFRVHMILDDTEGFVPASF